MDTEMLDLMESQVVRLSNILAERERELAMLHTTVEGQCAERHQLIAALKAYHDADTGGGGGGGGAGGGGGGGGVYGELSKGGGMITPSQSPSKAAPAAPAAPEAPLSFAAQALANATALSPRKIGRRMRPVAAGKAFK